ncbi:hypothetical protein J1614_005438 [Plenodomus biglobosus]|nr:hypothetical protein J1614_005438 [Plenodomus biglobosus]
MEHSDNVTTWLKSLTIEDGNIELNQNKQSEPQKPKIEPITPPRRASETQISEDPSPISTIFSDRSSVFDTPLRKTHQGFNQIDDNFSDSTSIDNDERQGKAHGEPIVDITPVDTTPQLPSPPESLHSYDPPSSTPSITNDTCEPNAHNTHTLHDPSTPRAVTITSCLQCTLARLPCSRTPPSCTRCTRNGHPESCLLTRRLFPEEVARSDCNAARTLTLLKLRGADEELWARKLQVRDELVQEWRDRQDRLNWVLPSWDGEVGQTRRGEERRRVVWEGEGRVVFRELCVDLEG